MKFAVLFIAVLYSSFLALDVGRYFSVVILQNYASLPTKPAWPQHGNNKCWLRGPRHNGWEIHWSHLCWSFCQLLCIGLGEFTSTEKLHKCGSRTCSTTILMHSESHANTIWVCEVLVRETVPVKITDIQICKDRWAMLRWKE